MVITRQMTENDILRTNIQNYWNNFSESEQKWLMDHIVLEQDKTCQFSTVYFFIHSGYFA